VPIISYPWARVAGELGYADLSHMIAEFRELSSLTPERLATERWFHPFILKGQDARPTSASSALARPIGRRDKLRLRLL
jgi:AraC-like DNA-binding protein